MPDYDYTENANDQNASASYTPNGGRHFIPDFIHAVWEVYAERAYEEIFD